MINLTTNCGKSETLLAALTLIFFVAPAISFGQFEKASEVPQITDPGFSVLELSDFSEGTSTVRVQEPQGDPLLELPPMLSNDPTAIPQDQQADVPEAVAGAELEEPQVLLRGPLHEAFADAHQADPQPNPIVNDAPPEAINEVPPEFKPEGQNVEWIPGYWAWVETQNDFIWISGVWRDVPPNQRWVPGYWEQEEIGYRWIAGFWTGLEQQELNYLPTPPENLDRGPSVAAPSDDYFYCPGNWEYQNSTYVWRTGHWQPRVANWIWIPARYIWTPRGCIYRSGYWDREFDVRGTLFAPVHFQQRQYLANNYFFRPNHCVNTGADFFVHLFVRTNCNHYFYGDWYGQNFVNTGFRPWVRPQSHLRNYDPLLAHYNCSRYRQGNQLFISWVNNQHHHYHRNRDHRPRNTLQAHINFSKSRHDQRHHDFIKRANLANRYDDIVRGRANAKNALPHSKHNSRNNNPNFKRQYVRTNHQDRDRHDINKRLQREIENTRRQAEQRARNSGRNGNRNDNRDLARRKRVDLPKAEFPRSTTRNNRGNTNGLTRAQIEKAQRDRENAIRKRELDQKIAAAKQQAEIKRKQREATRELSKRQQQQTLEQTRQRLAREKQARLANRNQGSTRNQKRIEEPRARSSASQDRQKMLEERRRKQQLAQQQAQRQQQSNRNGLPKGREQSGQNTQRQTTRQKADLAKQQRESVRQQRETQNRIAAERAKQAAQQKTAQAREASRQRILQRQRENAAKAQADAQKRNEVQAKIAREKSRRDAERRAVQQRAQQKAQADAQRRQREKAQKDAQRNAANQARRAADAARKRKREQEQAARRAKRKKK